MSKKKWKNIKGEERSEEQEKAEKGEGLVLMSHSIRDKETSQYYYQYYHHFIPTFLYYLSCFVSSHLLRIYYIFLASGGLWMVGSKPHREVWPFGNNAMCPNLNSRLRLIDCVCAESLILNDCLLYF